MAPPRSAARCALLLAALAAAPAPAVERAGAKAVRPRVQIDVSQTANLVHWVDNLAGSSAGKTTPVFRHYWQDRFGPPDQADLRALEAFARIRRLRVPLPDPGVGNQEGCLPVWREGLSWRQLFMAEAMQAGSVEELGGALSPWLPEDARRALAEALERFRPRFAVVWRDMRHVRRFEGRLRRWLKDGPMLDYLAEVAAFLGVDPARGPSMKISLMALPYDGPTHAEADGEHLLIEIRPLDEPRDQVQVVAHEASHFLMRLMPALRLDAVARQAHAEGEAGALLWRYIWEGLPTALGQGLAEARLGKGGFGPGRPWYHLEGVDQAAKSIYPAVAEAIAASRRIDEGVVPRITRSLRATPLFAAARATDFLPTAFFAAGEGLAPSLHHLRRRLALRHDLTTGVFELDDPAGAAVVRRYACLGGVALVRPEELERAASLDGTPLLSADHLRRIPEEARRGRSVIAAARRAGGGTVFFLVIPRPEDLEPMIEAFGGLRGLPDEPVGVPGGAAPPSP